MLGCALSTLLAALANGQGGSDSGVVPEGSVNIASGVALEADALRRATPSRLPGAARPSRLPKPPPLGRQLRIAKPLPTRLPSSATVRLPSLWQAETQFDQQVFSEVIEEALVTPDSRYLGPPPTETTLPIRLPSAHPVRLPSLWKAQTEFNEQVFSETVEGALVVTDPRYLGPPSAELTSPIRLPSASAVRLPSTAVSTRFEASQNDVSSEEAAESLAVPDGESEYDMGEGGWLPSPLPSDQAGTIAHSPYASDFSPTPLPSAAMVHDAYREQAVYDCKRDVPTQHPWVEWGRVFYGDGITPRGKNWWGKKNLVRPKFYVYGDFRTGVSAGRNALGRTDNWSNRLNLDFDLQLTDTERFHAFVGPMDNAKQFTRYERVDGDWRFQEEFDLTPLTGFFEGDLGVMLGACKGQSSPFELPVTVGLVPLLFQNGIWMEDAVTGAAFSLPARHSRLLNWSNYDATFFVVADQLNSAAFAGQPHAAQAAGTAWFIEAYGGYIETGYAYVRDRNDSGRSYHNWTTSFTRRYWDRVSNSVRLIVNTGQDLPQDERTADGALLLVENSWISSMPLRVVPYANFFVGWDRPQSVARAGVSGGILRNTGINFDTDGLNGFATLDPTANDTAGGSIGIDLLGDDLDRQLLLEFSGLAPHGNRRGAVAGDQYAIGSRYQFPISNWSLLRFDAMYGWRRGDQDVYGTRMEYRWKF